MRCLAMTRSILILVAILVLSFGLQGCGPFQKYKKAYEIAIEQKDRIEENYAILQSKLAELEEANSKLEEKVVELQDINDQLIGVVNSRGDVRDLFRRYSGKGCVMRDRVVVLRA